MGLGRGVGIKFGADTSGAVRETDRLSRSLDSARKSAEGAGGGFDRAGNSASRLGKGATTGSTGIMGMGKSLGGAATAALGMAAAAAAAAAGLVALVRSSASIGDEIAKTAKKIGATTDELQRLRFATERSGGSADALTTALKKQSVMLVEASQGGAKQFRTTLDELGVSLESLQGKGAEERFFILADAVKSVEDPTRRTAAAMALFGARAGAELQPLLLEGSKGIKALGDEAQRLGVVISGDALVKAEGMADSMYNMEQAAKAASVEIGTAFAPALTRISEGTGKAVAANRDFIRQDLPGVIDGIANYYGTLVDLVGSYLGLWVDFGSAVGRLIEKFTPLPELLDWVGDKFGEASDATSDWLDNAGEAAVDFIDEYIPVRNLLAEIVGFHEVLGTVSITKPIQEQAHGFKAHVDALTASFRKQAIEFATAEERTLRIQMAHAEVMADFHKGQQATKKPKPRASKSTGREFLYGEEVSNRRQEWVDEMEGGGMSGNFDEWERQEQFRQDELDRIREHNEAKLEVELNARMRSIEVLRAMGVDPISLIDKELQYKQEAIDKEIELAVQRNATEAELLEIRDRKEQASHDARMKRLDEEAKNTQKRSRLISDSLQAMSQTVVGVSGLITEDSKKANKARAALEAVSLSIQGTKLFIDGTADLVAWQIPQGLAKIAGSAIAFAGMGKVIAEGNKSSPGSGGAGLGFSGGGSFGGPGGPSSGGNDGVGRGVAPISRTNNRNGGTPPPPSSTPSRQENRVDLQVTMDPDTEAMGIKIIQVTDAARRKTGDIR